MWQVQKHLQLRIEAQGKYMQNILEKAYHTLAGENMAAAATNFKGIGTQGIPNMKDFVSPLNNFPHFQDLNICGSDDHDEQLERPTIDGFITNEILFVDQKKIRTNNPFNGSGKGPLIWNDDNNNDLRLHDLGTTSSCISPQDVPNFKGDDSLDRSDDIESDPINVEIYDTKLSEKNFDSSIKLGITTPMINAVAAGRSTSSFG
jgi:hypothetical protein